MGTNKDRNLSMGNNEGNVEDTLKQRGSIYGSYNKSCKARRDIMNIIKDQHKNVNGVEMDTVTEVGFSDLVLKLVRASGKPSYADSFHDLGGYAKLMEDKANEIEGTKYE